MTIRRTILLGIVCLIALPMFFVPFVTSQLYQSTLEKQIIRASQQNLTQIVNNLQFIFTSMMATANILCDDQSIISTLEKGDASSKLERFINYRMIEKRIAAIGSASLIPYNADIFVLSEAGAIYSTLTMKEIEQAIQQVRQEKDREIRAIGRYVIWIAPMDVDSGAELRNSFALVKTINGQSGKVLGVVVINLYIDQNVQKIYATDASAPQTEILLVNENDELIYSSADRGAAVEPSLLPRMDGAYGSVLHGEGAAKSIVNYQSVSRTGWKVIQISSYHEEMKEMVSLGKQTILINLVFLAVILLVAGLFANRIAMPLHELCELMSRLPGGDFSIRMKNKRGRGEVAQLTQGFNHMVAQTEEMFRQLERAYQAHENLRLEALRSQVNPHFLFNTLNTIKWIAMMNRDMQVGNAIASLGHLLQSTLASNEEMVSVEEELACIQDYIVIQKMRFGDKFELTIRVPEALRAFRVPLLIFQPIVENSILHAFEQMDSGGDITISGQWRKEEIVFCVHDNGKGMDGDLTPNELDKHVRKRGKFNGIGLQNVDERIKIIYGEAYGLSIASKPREGTDVYLHFPLSSEEAHDQNLIGG